MKKNSLLNGVVAVGLALVFLSGTVIMISGWQFARALLAAAGLGVLGVCLVATNRIARIDWVVSGLFAAYIVSTLISIFVNQDYRLAYLTIGLAALFFFLACYVPAACREASNTVVLWTALASHVPLVLLPMLAGSVRFPYSGVFYNPNSFGTVVATIFAVGLAAFLESVESKKGGGRTGLFVTGGLVMASFAAVAISASRTSFLAVVLLLLVFIWYLLRRSGKGTESDRGRKIGWTVAVGTAVGFALLYVLLPIQQIVKQNIVSKFQLKGSQRLTSGRLEIWERTVSEATWFGNGSEYFGGYSLGAHNTFISVLGQYGWVPLLLFSLFIAVALWRTWSHALHSRVETRYRLLPFAFVFIFLMLSMGEGMGGKLSMLGAFCGIGVATRRTTTEKA